MKGIRKHAIHSHHGSFARNVYKVKRAGALTSLFFFYQRDAYSSFGSPAVIGCKVN